MRPLTFWCCSFFLSLSVVLTLSVPISPARWRTRQGSMDEAAGRRLLQLFHRSCQRGALRKTRTPPCKKHLLRKFSRGCKLTRFRLLASKCHAACAARNSKCAVHVPFAGLRLGRFFFATPAASMWRIFIQIETLVQCLI